MLDLLAAAAHGAEGHADVTAFGIPAGGYVALAMIVVFMIALWAGAPRIIAKVLDDRISGIRKQLDEARTLRAEAEKALDAAGY